MSETIPPSWMTEERAAEVANDCNEEMTGQLRKHELIAAVQWWSQEAAKQASEFALYKASIDITRVVNELNSAYKGSKQ